MEETTFVSGITKPSEQSSLTLPSEIPDSKPGPRETILAVIMCVCLVAMISFVVVVVVSSSDLVGGGPGVTATDDLREMKSTTGPAAATKVEGTVSTKPRMGGSQRVTVQQMSTAASTERTSPTTSPLTTSTTTATTTTSTTMATTTTTTAMTTMITTVKTTTTTAMTTMTTTVKTTTTTETPGPTDKYC